MEKRMKSKTTMVELLWPLRLTWCLFLTDTGRLIHAAPLSKPYIAYRTDPFDQDVPHRKLDFKGEDERASVRPYLYDEVSPESCPLPFSIGISRKLHKTSSAIKTNPVLSTVFPSHGPGKQVIYNTVYEHLDLLSPALLQQTTSHDSDPVKEVLVQAPDYPILYESSSFVTYPILHDVNADGIMDVILSDYDGGVRVTGLASMDGVTPRYQHSAQVPRLYLRREWIASLVNTTASNEAGDRNEEESNTTFASTTSDPYHSYFEYYTDTDKNGLVRGETANILQQDSVAALAVQNRKILGRRLQEANNNLFHGLYNGKADPKDNNSEAKEDATENEESPELGAGNDDEDDEEYRTPQLLADDLEIPELDETDRGQDDMTRDDDADDDVQDEDDGAAEEGDDIPSPREEEESIYMDDMEYSRMHPYDDYGRYHGGYGDDMYGYNEDYSDHYDTKHYIRVPPHILTTPVLCEVPKLYGSTEEKEDILLVAVSYYLDEDEYDGFVNYKRFDATDHGDESEVRRGGFVASAIMAYVLGEGARWTGQTHLDLSTDFSAPENVTIVGALPIRSDTTQLSAFALSTPTVADLTGDGQPEALIGTSMGFVYAFDARQMFKRDKWPIQMKRPVEHRILVEDVLGNTNLEVFVADIGGNVVCLNAESELLWHRNLLKSLDGLTDNSHISASSPMTLGDVDGDGVLDLVQVIRVNNARTFAFALNAATGAYLPHFPIELDGEPSQSESSDLHQKLAQPMLVDLHEDQQTLWEAYIRRNGTDWKQRKSGRLSLHIVQPHGEDVFIVEGHTGCTQKISIGERVSAMVQVDDVHGTNKLDLVVATDSGSIVTFESLAPFHPLNTWSAGEIRGRFSQHAHGYSASQGIFVHSVSRQFIDILGVYVPITFEIFDNRPNISNEPNRRKYVVEIRDGPSNKRALWRNEYTEPGKYTDRVYIRYGPGYYNLHVTMQTSHGIMYEDQFSLGYNVKFLDGFGILLWFPLLVSAVTIFMCGAKKIKWDDEEFDKDRKDGGRGILGSALPT